MLIIFYILLDVLIISLRCIGHYDDVCMVHILHHIVRLLLGFFVFSLGLLSLHWSYATFICEFEHFSGFSLIFKPWSYCLRLRSHYGTNVCKLLISVKQCKMELVRLFSRYMSLSLAYMLSFKSLLVREFKFDFATVWQSPLIIGLLWGLLSGCTRSFPLIFVPL